jgi:hypothetical protein
MDNQSRKTSLLIESARRMADNRRQGLAYGLLAGGAYALACWGLDTAIGLKVAMTLPLLKLALGGAACLAAGAAAGWLTGVLDRALAGLAIWLVAGGLITWLAAHLPFDGLSVAVGLLDPRFAGQPIYPFPSVVELRSQILYVSGCGLAALGGILQIPLMDMSRGVDLRLGRLLYLALCIPIFALSGAAADNIINDPMRQPLIGVYDLMEYAMSTAGQPPDPRMARQKHLGALGGVQTNLSPGFHLGISDYDSESMYNVTVEAQFAAGWVRCWTIGGTPGVCRDTAQIYRDDLACILGQADPEASCDLGLSPGGQSWVAAQRGKWPDPPMVTIEALRGRIALVRVTGPSSQAFDCLFHGAQAVRLEYCTPSD